MRLSQKENPINYIYGPLICGEALDVMGNYILSGSWRDHQRLEIWDLRKFQLLKEIPWEVERNQEKSYIYSAQFSKFTENLVIAGGSGNNEIRVFKQENKENLEYKLLETIKESNKSIYTLDFCFDSDKFAYGDGEGNVGIIDLF